MKKATNKKVLLHKRKDNIKKRAINSANRPISSNSIYEEIKRRGGHARVCIVRGVGGIGDVLMTTPTLLQLKREFPNVHLTYAVDKHTTPDDTYTQLVYNAPFINEIIDARYVERHKYDAVVDISAVCIRYERRGLPSINRIDLFARACGINRLRRKIPFYQVTSEERMFAEVKLSHYRKNGKYLVALHTASFEGKRSWTPAHYLQLIKHAEKHSPNIQFLIMDFNKVLGDTSRFSNCVDVSDTKIREKAALIEAADLFIGPDSGPMHIAGAVGTESLVFFGSIPPEARINFYPTHTAIRNEGLSCLGCWYEACPIRVKCMTSITHLMVYNKILEKIKAQHAKISN